MNVHEQKQLLLLMQEAYEEAYRDDSKIEQVMHIIKERMQEMYNTHAHSR
ncbi:hypothetical protein QYG89_06790 [Bacillus sp. B190/17]|uniref:Aspartyl-phosphate phosphatase Spo0E family protein n=1 Tax=Bacillus lumedeiriae TaxID=3058829 RepID=A0ABW8I9J2_9BACI